MSGSQTRQSTDRRSVLVGHFHQFRNGFQELLDLAVIRCDLACIRCDLACIRCDLACTRCDLACTRCDLACTRCDLAVIRCDTAGIRVHRMTQQLKVHRQCVEPFINISLAVVVCHAIILTQRMGSARPYCNAARSSPVWRKTFSLALAALNCAS